LHDRMLHRPHARFATPVPAKGGAGALVLSPRSERVASARHDCFCPRAACARVIAMATKRKSATERR